MKFSKQQQQELLDLVESARAKENDDSTTRIIALIEHQYKIYVGNQVGEKEVDKAKQQLLNDIQSVIPQLTPGHKYGDEDSDVEWLRYTKERLWRKTDIRKDELIRRFRHNMVHELESVQHSATDAWGLTTYWPAYMETLRHSLAPRGFPKDLLVSAQRVYVKVAGKNIPNKGVFEEVSGASLTTRDGIDPFPVTAQALLGKVINMILDRSKDKKYAEVIDALEGFRDALIAAKNKETEVKGDTRRHHHHSSSTDSSSGDSEVSYDAETSDVSEGKVSQKNHRHKSEVKRKRMSKAVNYTKRQKH